MIRLPPGFFHVLSILIGIIGATYFRLQGTPALVWALVSGMFLAIFDLITALNAWKHDPLGTLEETINIQSKEEGEPTNWTQFINKAEDMLQRGRPPATVMARYVWDNLVTYAVIIWVTLWGTMKLFF